MSEKADSTRTDIDYRLRPTWELELLISGAVVFTLFRVPSNLDATLEKLRVFFSQSQLFTSFFFYAYLKMIIFVLIAAFLLHLLAPNQRPQQITHDLASFWNNTYPEVRRELKGRYPKHAWPDDPTQARPERRPRRKR